MKVLVADNNLHTLDHLSALLEKEGLETVKAQSGEDALAAYNKSRPDFICLDIMMEDMSGYDVCRQIRQNDNMTPIIFISSKSDTVDKVVGLEVGADDYIVKPFDIKEVTARIRAVTRRCLARDEAEQEEQKATPDRLDNFEMSGLKIYPRELVAKKDGRTIELNLRDIKILNLLHEKKNEVVDRNVLLDLCWGAHIMPESRTVDWHISQLRKKVEEDPKNPQLIQTVHGVGYRYIDKQA